MDFPLTLHVHVWSILYKQVIKCILHVCLRHEVWDPGKCPLAIRDMSLKCHHWNTIATGRKLRAATSLEMSLEAVFVATLWFVCWPVEGLLYFMSCKKWSMCNRILRLPQEIHAPVGWVHSALVRWNVTRGFVPAWEGNLFDLSKADLSLCKTCPENSNPWLDWGLHRCVHFAITFYCLCAFLYMPYFQSKSFKNRLD